MPRNDVKQLCNDRKSLPGLLNERTRTRKFNKTLSIKTNSNVLTGRKGNIIKKVPTYHTKHPEQLTVKATAFNTLNPNINVGFCNVDVENDYTETNIFSTHFYPVVTVIVKDPEAIEIQSIEDSNSLNYKLLDNISVDSKSKIDKVHSHDLTLKKNRISVSPVKSLKYKNKPKPLITKTVLKSNHRLKSLRPRKNVAEINRKEIVVPDVFNGPVCSVFTEIDSNQLNKIEVLEECLAKGPKIKRKCSSSNTYQFKSNRIQLKKGIEQNSDITLDSTNKRKRTCNMSLYEQRYTNDDSRNVANGYGTSTRSSTSAVHTDIDAQEMSTHNQYYMSTSTAALSSSSTSNVGSLQSMATLCNIGNTCYLNSVVYTLRFAPQFLHNLHHLIADLSTIQLNSKQRCKSSSLGRGISSMHIRSWSNKDLASLEQYNYVSNAGNASNQKSSHQLLTEKLHELYQNLHHNEIADSTEPFHADTLLHAIQDVSAIFEGNQQQDAHEFLMCLLNSIRETCQVLIKTIAECPDIITNGYVSYMDELDNGYTADKNVEKSLGISNSTKNSFLRKTKRKEDTKNSKNHRVQSPLKESSNSGINNSISNSLFYLNTVDLASTNAQTNHNNANAVNSSTTSKSFYGDDSVIATTLKDKERLTKKIKDLGLDFFSEDFEGITVSTTKCLSCETITEQKERMIDIAVPVPISGCSDYMEKSNTFIQNSCVTREYFRGENKYRCEKCTGYTEAIRSISYEVLPRLLVIQLSRFSGGMEKINSYIPTSFTLQCFCAKCCELSDANKLHIYKLYSVITHVGATMSVGHYIAYTCSLDWANEYINCPKDRRNNQTANQHTNNTNSNVFTQVNSNERTQGSQSSSASAAASAIASSGSKLIKKMIWSKASSSGDMSKSIKNSNSANKSITNGISKTNLSTTCNSLNCCATRTCAFQYNNTEDLSEESLQNGFNYSGNINNTNYNNMPTSYGSTGRAGIRNPYKPNHTSTGNSGSEPIWYMCDDDKIKAMTQKEFEDLLSPTRKITITPYLLFYARFDLQQATNQTSKQITSSKPTWSNESLASYGLQKV
ncbi:ubiquitin carboxyl-terminal hydrolase 1 [Teleopsis dalmanni]|uniref:ubiquitin carboxyl-terminal hydrolase 1 n=1 Tax=Teleopsis dalmanni TaxID=139649 RepID=UPI0018CE94ED|nr:ubiquitin carboxyl-terminal hydrolase 1 [Teleopsis dalmanni]